MLMLEESENKKPKWKDKHLSKKNRGNCNVILKKLQFNRHR